MIELRVVLYNQVHGVATVMLTLLLSCLRHADSGTIKAYFTYAVEEWLCVGFIPHRLELHG